MPSLGRILLLTTAIALAVAGLPLAASADSVVYLKGGMVWIASPDGSGARQFTLYDYNWNSPSQADDGTIVAAGGLARSSPDGTAVDASSELYRFSGDGNQIGDAIPTFGSFSSSSCPATAPTSVRVSPDAGKIAYGIFACSNFTAMWTPSTATGLDFPNQTLGQEDYFEPAWVDSTHFSVSHVGTTVTPDQFRWYVHSVTDDDNVGPGWTEPDTMTGTGAQGVVNRQGTRFAIFEDDTADFSDGQPRNVNLWLYTSPDLATAEASGWTFRCKVALDETKFADPLRLSPSFSPDGTKLMWADDDGVEVTSVADIANSTSCAATAAHLLIAGGSQPFYGKGDIQAPTASPDQPGAPPASTGGNPPGGNPAGGNTNPGGSPNGVGAVPPKQPKPHGAFKVKTKHPHARRKVRFDAGKSFEAGGKIVAWSWRFGDGKKAKGRRVSHRFKKPGTYTVTLIVRDKGGRTAKVKHKIKVKP